MTNSTSDPSCAMARGDLAGVARSDRPAADPPGGRDTGPVRTLVAVFASPVAGYLLHFGRDLGFRTVLVEPDARRAELMRQHADSAVATLGIAELDDRADVVVTDHDRPELGPVLRDVLARPVRWVGVMGSPRHPAPHIPALHELGVSDSEIARVHRPIGLNIGSRTPPEIALATLAGLIADRSGRPGGFDFG